MHGHKRDARTHHASPQNAQFLDALIGNAFGTYRAFFQRFLVQEQRPDHGRGGRVQQDVGEPARLDLQRGIKWHKRAFVYGAQQGLGRREGTLGLAVDHRIGPDKRHEARRVIGGTTGHLVALGVPGFQNVRILCIQHPFFRGGYRISDNFVDQTGRFRSSRRNHLAFQQEGRCGHRAQFARQTGGAARAGEDADHDLGQTDTRLWVVGDKDAVRGQRQFKPDARGCAGQGRGNRLAALVGFCVHARAFDLAQQSMHFHRAVKQPLCRIIACVFAHLGKQVQVHTTGKGPVLARGDHGPLDGVVGQDRVDDAVQLGQALDRHDVHGFSGHVPGDDGDAVGVCLHGEIGHLNLSLIWSVLRALRRIVSEFFKQ